jgi:hypothetical protein
MPLIFGQHYPLSGAVTDRCLVFAGSLSKIETSQKNQICQNGPETSSTEGKFINPQSARETNIF